MRKFCNNLCSGHLSLGSTPPPPPASLKQARGAGLQVPLPPQRAAPQAVLSPTAGQRCRAGGPHPRAEVSRGGPTPGSGRGSGEDARGRPPASGPHQQLSFRTLCSSEALARDKTIFRVSFMVAGARDSRPRPGPLPARYREDFRFAAARLHGAWPASSGAGLASPLASFARGRALLDFGSPRWLRLPRPAGRAPAPAHAQCRMPGSDVFLQRPEMVTRPQVLRCSPIPDLRTPAPNSEASAPNPSPRPQSQARA